MHLKKKLWKIYIYNKWLGKILLLKLSFRNKLQQFYLIRSVFNTIWHTYIFYVYNIISPPFRSFQKYPCDVSVSRKEYFKFKCVCLTDSVPLFFRRRNFVDKCAGPPSHWGLFAQWHVFCTAALWLHIFKANTWKFQRHHRRQRAPALSFQLLQIYLS